MPPKIDKRSDPEYIEMINFLIEKTRDAKSSLIIKQLAEEFKEKSGSSQQVDCWRLRIGTFRSKIHEMDSIDTEQKVKMIFGLSVPIDLNYLNELQKDAHVEVDGKYRIVKYRANDGSMELEGDHSKSTKAKAELCRRQNTIDENLDDSDDGSMDPASKRAEDPPPDCSAGSPETRTTGFVRGFSPQPPDPTVQQLFQPKKEREMGSEKSQNDPYDKFMNRIPKNPGSVKRAATEMPNSFKRAKDSSAAPSMKSEAHAPDDISRVPESEAREPPIPKVQQLRQPEGEGALVEAIQSLVLNLDMPSLSPLQAKIEKKIRESSSNQKIANVEIILAIEVLVTKVVNRSVLNLSETVESISLKEFLCYLKAAILNSKLEGLEYLLEKIKKRIKEPTSNDKNIPVEKVASALQYTLDGTSF